MRKSSDVGIIEGLTFDDLAKLIRPGDRFSFEVKPGHGVDMYSGVEFECINWPYAPVWPDVNDDIRIEFMYLETDKYRPLAHGTFYRSTSQFLVFSLTELAE